MVRDEVGLKRGFDHLQSLIFHTSGKQTTIEEAVYAGPVPAA